MQMNRENTTKQKPENIKLELQLLDRLTFVKLQQSKIEEAFSLLRDSQVLARTHSLDISLAEIAHKIKHLEEIY